MKTKPTATVTMVRLHDATKAKAALLQEELFGQAAGQCKIRYVQREAANGSTEDKAIPTGPKAMSKSSYQRPNGENISEPARAGSSSYQRPGTSLASRLEPEAGSSRDGLEVEGETKSLCLIPVPKNVNSKQLEDMFRKFGPVRSSHVLWNKAAGASVVFFAIGIFGCWSRTGFVNMVNLADAQTARRELQGHKLFGNANGPVKSKSAYFPRSEKAKSLLQSHLPKNPKDLLMALDFLHRQNQFQLLLSEIDNRQKATSSAKPTFTRLTTLSLLRPASATLEKAIRTFLRIISAKKIAGQASRSLGLWRDDLTADLWAYLRRFGTTRPRTRRLIDSISLSEGDPWHIDWATSSGNLSLLLGLAIKGVTCERFKREIFWYLESSA
jgi:RNA recognition motif-containing protein